MVELTLDQSIPEGKIVGENRSVPENMMAQYGQILSENATLETSSSNPGADRKENHERFFRGNPVDYAFHTKNEKNPWAKVDLGAVKNVKGIMIENRFGDQRSQGLIMSVSEDGQEWTKLWQDEAWDNKWFVPVTRFHSGIDVLGRPVRYLKLELPGEGPRGLLLKRITVYGDESPAATP